MNEEQPKEPPPRAKSISLADKLAFSSGVIAAQSSTAIMNQMLVPIYQITLGLNPLLIGLVQTIMRLWDAISDPLVANWSDNTRSRWGRRRPFIFVGGVVLALVFPLIWMPSQAWGEWGLFIYLTIASVVFLTAHTVYNIPYEALGLELTDDYNERTRLYAFRGYIPPVLGLAASWLYAFIQSDFFASTLDGMRIVAWILGGLMFVTALWPAILLRERKPKEIVRQAKMPLLQSIGTTFRNRAFLCVIAMLIFAQLAANLFSQFGLYAQIYVLYDGDTKAGAMLTGWISVVYFVVFMLSVGLGSLLAQRYSKRAVMFVGAGLTFLTGIGKLFLYNPDYPYLVLLVPVLSAPNGAISSFMINAMMADVAYYDQWKTGVRREAIYTATASWLYKLSFSLSGILSGAMLVAVGFNVDLGGNQSDLTKFWLVFGMVLGSCIPAIITAIALWFYPLSPSVMEKCRREIDERDASASDSLS